jgi:hypothetical protein
MAFFFKHFRTLSTTCQLIQTIPDINDIYDDGILPYTKLNLNLNLGDGYLYGDVTTTGSMSYKINIQQGWPDTTLIVPTDSTYIDRANLCWSFLVPLRNYRVAANVLYTGASHF